MPGVESRTGGASGEHTIVFTFAHALSSVGGAVVTSGIGSVSESGIGSETDQYFVTLAGVTNAQEITIGLTNVSDSFGNFSSAVAATMGVLLGDSNGDRTVNSGDAQQTRTRSGQATDASNFRSDYNLDGIVNSGDAAIVRARSGSSIP